MLILHYTLIWVLVTASWTYSLDTQETWQPGDMKSHIALTYLDSVQTMVRKRRSKGSFGTKMVG